MKKILKIISTTSIFIFLILGILTHFMDESKYNTKKNRNIILIVCLASGLKYFRMEVNDKNTEIESLKAKLEENNI